ncbi:hypothetical protein R1sor_006272 [Riccia sorocarpa]|uniref:START domain-containing protein n=1 Tax=Riccia sorocarpa TaxID=122646 RepID=A0ABD3HR69_9MARC
MELRSSDESRLKWRGSVTAAIASPIDRTWQTASDFSGLHKFVPNVEICERLKGRNRVPGCVRFYTLYSPSGLPGGRRKGWAKERLLEIDEQEHSYTYVVEGSNMNLRDCMVTFKASTSKEEDGESGTRVDWSYTLSPIRKSTEEKILSDMSEFGWTFIKGLEAAVKEELIDFEGKNMPSGSSGSSESSEGDEFNLKNLIQSRHGKRVSMDKNLSGSTNPAHDDDDVASSSGSSSSLDFPTPRPKLTRRRVNQEARNQRRSGNMPPANPREQEDDQNGPRPRGQVPTSRGPYHALQLAADRLTGDVQDDIARQLESVEQQLEEVGLQMQEAVASGLQDGTFKSRRRSSDVEPPEPQPLPLSRKPPAAVRRKRSSSIQKIRDGGSQTPAIGMRNAVHTDSHYTDRVSQSTPDKSDQNSSHPPVSRKSGVSKDNCTGAGSSSAMYTEAHMSDYESSPTKEDGPDPGGDSGDSTSSSDKASEPRGCQTCRCQSCRVPSGPAQTVQILGKVGNPQSGSSEFVKMEINSGRIPKSLGLIEICRDFQARVGDYAHTWKEASVLRQFNVEHSFPQSVLSSSCREPQLDGTSFNKAELGGNSERDPSSLETETGKWKDYILRSEFVQKNKTPRSSYDVKEERSDNNPSPALYRSDRDKGSESGVSSCSYNPEGIVRPGIHLVIDKEVELPGDDVMDYSPGVEETVDEGATSQMYKSSSLTERKMIPRSASALQTQRELSRPSRPTEVRSVRIPEVEALNFEEDHVSNRSSSRQVKERWRSKRDVNTEQQSGYASGNWSGLTESNPSDQTTEDYEDCSNSMPVERKVSRKQRRRQLRGNDDSPEVEVNVVPRSDTRATCVAAHSSYEFVRRNEGISSSRFPLEALDRSCPDVSLDEPRPSAPGNLSKDDEVEKKNEARDRHVAISRLCIDIRQEYESGDDVSHQEVQNQMQEEIAKEFALLGLSTKQRPSKKSNRSKSESDLPTTRDFADDCDNGSQPEITKLAEGCSSLDYTNSVEPTFNSSKKLSPDGMAQKDSASRKAVEIRTAGPADRLNAGRIDSSSVVRRVPAAVDLKKRSKSARRPRFYEEELVEPSLLVRSADRSGRDVSHRRPTPYPLRLSQEARFRKEEFLEHLQTKPVLENLPAEEPVEVRQESDQLEWYRKNGLSSGTRASGDDVQKTRKSDAILQILNRKSSRSAGRKSRRTSVEHVVSHIPRDRSGDVQPRSELIDSTSRQDSVAQMEMNASEVPGNQEHESSEPPLPSDIADPLWNSRGGHFEDQEPPGRHPTMAAQNWNNPQILEETEDPRDRNGQRASKRSLKSLKSKNSQKYLAKMLSKLSQRISILQSQGLIEAETPPNSGGFGSQKVTPAESLDPRERHGSRGSSVQASETVEPEPRQQFDQIHLRKSQDMTNLLRRRSSDWPFQQDLTVETMDSVPPSLIEDISFDVQQITQIPEAPAKWSHQISRAGMMTNNLELLALERAGKWDRMRMIYQEQEDWQPRTPHSHRSRDLSDMREPKRKLPAVKSSADRNLRADEAESTWKREGEIESYAHSSFKDTPLRSTRNQTVLTENWRPTQRPSIHTQTSDEMSSETVREGQDGLGGSLSHLNTFLPPLSQRAVNSGALRKQSIHTQTSDGISSQDETQGLDREILPHPFAHRIIPETSSIHQPEWGPQKGQSMQTQTLDAFDVQNERRPHNREARVLPHVHPSIHLHISSSSEAPFELRTQRAENWGPRRSTQSVQTQTDIENELQHGRGTSGAVSGPPIHRTTPDSYRGIQHSSRWGEPQWDRSLEKWNPAASKEGQLRLQTGSGVQINQHKVTGALMQHDELRELPFSRNLYPERTDSVATHAGDLGFRGNQYFNHSSPQQQVEPFYRNGQQDPWLHQSTETDSRHYRMGREFQHMPGQEVPQHQMQQQSQLHERVPRSNHVSQHNQTMGRMGTGGMNFINPQYSLDERTNNFVAQPNNPNSANDLHLNERYSHHGVSSSHPNPGFVAQSGSLYNQRLQPETTTSVNQSGSYNHTRIHPEDVDIRTHQGPQVGRTYAVGGSSRANEFHPAQVGTVLNPPNIEKMHSLAMQPGGFDTVMQHHPFDTEVIYNPTMNHEASVSEDRQDLDFQRMQKFQVDRMHGFAVQPQTLGDSTGSTHSTDLNRMHSFAVQPQALDNAIRRASEIERMHSFAIQPQVLTDAILRASVALQNSEVQPSVSEIRGDQLYGQTRATRENPQRVPPEQSFPAGPDEIVPPLSEKMGSSAQATVSRSRHTSREEPTPRSGEQVKSSGPKTGKSLERMHSLVVQPTVRNSGSRLSSQKQVVQKGPSHPSVVQQPQKAAKDLKASQKDRHGVAATAQKRSSSSDHRSMDDLPPEVLHLGSKNSKKSSQMQVLNNLLQDLEATVSRSRQNSRDRRKSKMVEHEPESRNDKNVMIKVQGQKGHAHQERNPEEGYGDTSSEHLETETLESHDDSIATPETFHQENYDGEGLIPHPGYEVEGEPLHPFEGNDEEVTGSHPVQDDILGQDGDGQSYQSSDYISEKQDDELTDITESSQLPEEHDSMYSDNSTHDSREITREMRVSPVKDQGDVYAQSRSQVEAKDMTRASTIRSQTEVDHELRRPSSKSVMKDQPRKSSIKNPPPIKPGESKPKNGVKEDPKPSGSTSQMQMDDGSGKSGLRGQMGLPRQDNHRHSQQQNHQISNQSEDTESEHATTPLELESLVSQGGSVEEVFTPSETEGEAHSPYEVENQEITPLETQGNSSAESEDDEFSPRETGDDYDDSPESPQPVQRRVAFQGLDEEDPRLKAKTKRVESIVKDFVEMMEVLVSPAPPSKSVEVLESPELISNRAFETQPFGAPPVCDSDIQPTMPVEDLEAQAFTLVTQSVISSTCDISNVDTRTDDLAQVEVLPSPAPLSESGAVSEILESMLNMPFETEPLAAPLVCGLDTRPTVPVENLEAQAPTLVANNVISFMFDISSVDTRTDDLAQLEAEVFGLDPQLAFLPNDAEILSYNF